MLKLSLSKLENARTNPIQVAQILLQEEKQRGGSQGFLSTFKSGARNYHEYDLNVDTAIQHLDEKLWVSFKDIPANKSRRNRYCDSFKDYAKLFEKMNLKVDSFQINLDWEIISNAKLTGHSPFLCSCEKNNIAYYFRENGDGWKNELKYPLLQIYLAERYFKCDAKKLKIGIYNIFEKRFDLNLFSDFELDNAFEEAKIIFKNVQTEYNKHV